MQYKEVPILLDFSFKKIYLSEDFFLFFSHNFVTSSVIILEWKIVCRYHHSALNIPASIKVAVGRHKKIYI